MRGRRAGGLGATSGKRATGWLAAGWAQIERVESRANSRQASAECRANEGFGAASFGEDSKGNMS
jgi:hypothetical protein